MGVSAGHIRGRSTTGVVPVLGAYISESDVEAALDAGRVGRVDNGRVLLHTLVREYVVDQRDGIRRPVGMTGARLEARAHLVTASEAAITNLTRCASACDLNLRGVVLDTLASSQAVLTARERELGCVLVDIGGGTTDIAIWSEGTLAHSAVIPYGGDTLDAQLHVTPA